MDAVGRLSEVVIVIAKSAFCGKLMTTAFSLFQNASDIRRRLSEHGSDDGAPLFRIVSAADEVDSGGEIRDASGTIGMLYPERW
jgi:hypothetical protein